MNEWDKQGWWPNFTCLFDSYISHHKIIRPSPYRKFSYLLFYLCLDWTTPKDHLQRSGPNGKSSCEKFYLVMLTILVLFRSVSDVLLRWEHMLTMLKLVWQIDDKKHLFLFLMLGSIWSSSQASVRTNKPHCKRWT